MTRRVYDCGYLSMPLKAMQSLCVVGLLKYFCHNFCSLVFVPRSVSSHIICGKAVHHGNETTGDTHECCTAEAARSSSSRVKR